MDETIEKIKNETDVFAKAKLIRYLLREKNFKVIDLAKKLDLTSSYICHLNRLNSLSEIIVDGYYSKLVNISHLFLLSRIKDKKKLIEIYEKVLTDNLTIRQTEELIREVLYEIKTKGSYLKVKDKRELIENFEKKYPDLEVNISQTRMRAKIIFEIKGNLEKTTKFVKELERSISE
ncbi:MAG: ParB-like protein partition protein [Candidatus Roizmanbacteria bacterium GW2011_GWC2_37_13]|uniref:ParB-like protein partition protein n=1 Tax=Candidatus Roizmanbacteria bacterium GW2011_GWC2_37_13 TaxID=1618486 RepID=A0A0G0G5T2_9BACT|nr:MAG: ParB-like protein partition protein [Candidatus Roizmanbacteria bacterium GW2011_GWC1_37_12]KKQ26473.1 MAG: ParB-like protein partition protein [Candidatus Roizmanbacteria bacterium GW2011_GWC2_37_13]